MASHASPVSHAVKGHQNGPIAHMFMGASLGGKHPCPPTRQVVKLSKYDKRLSRERHDMRAAHLHASRGNDPFAAVEVEFVPARADQLAGAHEHQQQKPERSSRFGVEASFMFRKRFEKYRQLIGLDGGKVAASHRFQSTMEMFRWIALCAVGDYGVAE